MDRSRSRASASWSWWSTSMPVGPSACSSASVASSGRPRPPRPHGCAMTEAPPRRRPRGGSPPTGRRSGRRGPGVPSRGSGRRPSSGRARRRGHQCVGDVRSAGGRGAVRSPSYVVLGDVDAEPVEPRHHRRDPRRATTQHLLDSAASGVGRVDEEGQQVHAATPVAGADLHAGHEGQPGLGAACAASAHPSEVSWSVIARTSSPRRPRPAPGRQARRCRRWHASAWRSMRTGAA